MSDIHRCECGASGDPGEIEEHQVSKISDTDAHRLVRGTESARVSGYRDRVAQRSEVMARLAEVTGMTVETIRQSLTRG